MKRRVIAEIGSCGGDLALAIDTAEAAVEAGAWMVKGQMYEADRLVTRTAPTYGKSSIREPATQHTAFRKALTYDEWGAVAAAVPGQFFASVFDIEACHDYPYQWIKIASADITYRALIEAAAATGRKLIVSTGGASRADIHRALTWINGVHPTLLACTLSYPTQPADANVARLIALQEFHVPTGYSDHTRGTAAANVAFALGATMVEKHFTITPGEGGDHDFAIGPDELSDIASGQEPTEAQMKVYGGSQVIGPRITERRARLLARRSLRAAAAIPIGTRITKEMVAVLRPSGGMEPWLLYAFPEGPLGAYATRQLAVGDAITPDAFTR